MFVNKLRVLSFPAQYELQFHGSDYETDDLGIQFGWEK